MQTLCATRGVAADATRARLVVASTHDVRVLFLDGRVERVLKHPDATVVRLSPSNRVASVVYGGVFVEDEYFLLEQVVVDLDWTHDRLDAICENGSVWSLFEEWRENLDLLEYPRTVPGSRRRVWAIKGASRVVVARHVVKSDGEIVALVGKSALRRDGSFLDLRSGLVSPQREHVVSDARVVAGGRLLVVYESKDVVLYASARDERVLEIARLIGDDPAAIASVAAAI